MKKFTRRYKITHYRSRIFSLYFGGMKPCVFDIETTGLQPGRAKVIMTALLLETDNGVEITQFLSEDIYEEDRVLTATLDFLQNNGVDYLITYNGAAFDIPFVQKRLKALSMDSESDYYDFDLYKVLSKYSSIREYMGSLKQKDVERYIGIADSRRDTITGRESIKLFYDYMNTGNSVSEKIILTHNREDVLQLYRILNVLSEADLHGAMTHYGFPVPGTGLTARPRIRKDSLIVKGRQLGERRSFRSFPSTDSEMSVSFDGDEGLYSIELPLSSYGSSKYVDLRPLHLNRDLSDALSLERLGGYYDGYLILIEDDAVHNRELNTFARLLADSVYKTYLGRTVKS